ncbi:hypothetical protein DL766_009750 [Monosporascus sp. MC13-8B]|uniref:Uncharacterized protein n=1 Tax=Monosporascus cannonballus TaxID=155416 RepID=A0ABY0H4X2_9PEZI|nr:hypothetical protein DL762_005795 [Monosporascus cannonballus]RYO84206.1 hypothetical protein DL763_007556 [Monosporascus cannonballus]RYP14173.1 hypothetical protein DL766_009750 [Monosporascus sp. MC13-8B]
MPRGGLPVDDPQTPVPESEHILPVHVCVHEGRSKAMHDSGKHDHELGLFVAAPEHEVAKESPAEPAAVALIREIAELLELCFSCRETADFLSSSGLPQYAHNVPFIRSLMM